MEATEGNCMGKWETGMGSHIRMNGEQSLSSMAHGLQADPNTLVA